MTEFKCSQCGECCRKRPIALTYTDITRWGREERRDILNHVKYWPKMSVFFLDKEKEDCPFLMTENEKISCGIYDTRPRVCKDFPGGHKDASECKSFDVSMVNITKLKRVRKSQKKDFLKAFRNQRLLFDIVGRSRWRSRR